MISYDSDHAYFGITCDEDIDAWIEYEKRKEFEASRNIKRDKRGRLNKKAVLAKKDNCDKIGILLRYKGGMSVKEIVQCMGCSKSTVYNVIKKYK